MNGHSEGLKFFQANKDDRILPKFNLTVVKNFFYKVIIYKARANIWD